MSTICFEDVQSGSTMLVLEVAAAIQAGKLEPFGYEQVADFFRLDKGRTTSAHNALLMAEAWRAGKIHYAKTEFPEAETQASFITQLMNDKHPEMMTAMAARLAKSDWTVDAVLNQQKQAGEKLQELLAN